MPLPISPPSPSLQTLQDQVPPSLTWVGMETVTCYMRPSSGSVHSKTGCEDQSVQVALLMLSLVQSQKNPKSANLL